MENTTLHALTITQPDDAHLHVRDGAALTAVVPHSAAHFARAVIMPNLRPPVVSTAQALAYRTRILAAVPEGRLFEPLMTLYLTEQTLPDEVVQAKEAGIIGMKLYPAGATTHADAGVVDLRRVYPVLEAMQRHGLPLLLHGEVTDPAVDLFDREAVFVEQVLAPLIQDFPALKLVLEHITTADAAAFVQEGPATLAATITAHHLLYNRNAIFHGGLRPHHYCLPVLKRERHRQALIQAATSGHPRIFLGTDSAPHPRSGKEADGGCAGCYTAPTALALYLEAFEQAGALHQSEAFASHYAADFYGLSRNTETITAVREVVPVPERYPFGEDVLIPLRAGAQVYWKVIDNVTG